ncbi:LVIVD repeat-containing protein [Microbacterium koreense]|uniref:LVIVD repeat-containing protein n=1 Tax=Microbacterium koreense TaxID=323761 RepID=A0ABW2ZP23_9MICO
MGAVTLGLSVVSATAATAVNDDADPREGLSAGLFDAGQAASNVTLLSTQPKTSAFNNYNSDLAFTGDYAISGNYNGFQIYDVSDAAAPELKGTYVCPGGQGDVSVYGNLLFMSVESGPGRIDCGTENPATSDPQNFRGVRVFDITDILAPVQVAAVQTCRGSHTHTVVEDADDADNVYVYVSGTAGVRTTSPNVPGGCTNVNGNTLESQLDAEGNPILGSRFLVEVIKVPLANPAAAEVVNKARLFADAETGSPAGLQGTPQTPRHPSGGSWSPSPVTDACHDITAYPEIGLAAGACEGNGILIDISDPANPQRVDEVSDPNFAYWHSATFNNDGTKVVFTDEWGGGGGARCRDTDAPEWGANAIFDIVDGKLEFASYYKMPAVQSATENCVAHNGSLVPVPGRDIMVQAWYQGGLSVFDFTDSANPVEIAYFDRGPVSDAGLVLAGYWSAYWYNGNIFGNEIGRGFDSLGLTASDYLSENELAAAAEWQRDEFNAQAQPTIAHAPSFAVAGSYIDQLGRTGADVTTLMAQFETAKSLAANPAKAREAIAALEAAAAAAGPGDVADALLALAATIHVDTTKPVTTLVAPTTAGPFNALQVQVDATDEIGLSRVVANIYQNGKLVKSTQTAGNGEKAVSHTATVTLPEGSYMVRYNSQDTAGNISATREHAFTIDTTAPKATVKAGDNFTVGADGTYSLVSFKLHDAGKIDKITLNGVVKDLSNNAWSDVNFVKPGTFGGQLGENTLVVYDVAGNTQTTVFTLVAP